VNALAGSPLDNHRRKLASLAHTGLEDIARTLSGGGGRRLLMGFSGMGKKIRKSL